jgi:hypothetical protein
MPTDTADKFAAMAERIRHNPSTEFGGAFVIVSPDGESRETLVLDSSSDSAQFFMVLQARIQTRLKEIEEKERVQFGYKR